MLIRLNSLKEGLQRIEGSLTKEELDISEGCFRQPSIDVDLTINKGSSEININGVVCADAEFKCDRCLNLFHQKLQANINVIITTCKIDPEFHDEDTISITPTTMEVDISSHIRDALLLTIPIKKLCDENCRGVYIKHETNLHEDEYYCQNSEVDNRWEPLKKLITFSTEE